MPHILYIFTLHTRSGTDQLTLLSSFPLRSSMSESTAASQELIRVQRGASQAIEDAASLARCLTLAKKNNQSTRVATNVYQRLRFDRVRKAQQVSSRQYAST